MDVRLYREPVSGRRHRGAARLAAWLARRQGKYPKVTDWVDEDIGSILSVYRLPRQHHQDLKNSSMLERLDAAIHTATRD